MKRILCILLLMLVIVMAACNRIGPDLHGLQTGKYYVAQCDDRDLVLYVEEVTAKSLKGRWYVEGNCFAQEHHFEATTGFWHRRSLKSESVVVKAGAMSGGDGIVLDVLLDGSWRTLCFLPWRQPSVKSLQRSYPYHDSLYPVSVDSVVYAYAEGYWASYPEPEYDCDKYFPILAEKWMDDEEMTLKDLELTMDIYSPNSSVAMPRPLLMLIHGGAFFNGDKQSAGYQEWGHYFSSRGYVVASINYRLGFPASLDADQIDRAGYRAVQDARAALSYLLRNADHYWIDPNCIFVAGTSAGAITALNLAFMTDLYRPDCTFADGDLDDLGDINKVADESGGSADFNINTVVNMWGAVHNIGMIDSNSPGTAILSFHGDADHVVAYDHDYPFTNTEPFNRILCNKMYGSQCIHEQALENGRESELHTKKGGGHSLHADCSELTDYFDTITNIMTRFLYLRLFPRPTINTNDVGSQRWYQLDNAGEVMTCRWEAKGGLVLEAKPDRARIIFFDDATQHKIRITGQKKDDEHYDETYDIRRQ